MYKKQTSSFLKEKYIVVFILKLFLLYKDTNYCYTFSCLDHEIEFSTQSTALTDNWKTFFIVTHIFLRLSFFFSYLFL